jgi:hypothetical protein
VGPACGENRRQQRRLVTAANGHGGGSLAANGARARDGWGAIKAAATWASTGARGGGRCDVRQVRGHKRQQGNSGSPRWKSSSGHQSIYSRTPKPQTLNRRIQAARNTFWGPKNGRAV